MSVRRFVVALAALVGLALVADIVARLWVEGRIEDRAEAELADVGSVDASIDSFPFLGRLAAWGEVNRSTLVLREITGVGIDVRELRLELRGAEFDRTSLLRGDRVELRDVDRVRVSVTIADRVLQAVAGVPVELRDDGARITAGGPTVDVDITVVESRLEFATPGGPVLATVPLPSSEVLPCDPDITVTERALVLRCTADDVPPLVTGAIGELTA